MEKKRWVISNIKKQIPLCLNVFALCLAGLLALYPALFRIEAGKIDKESYADLKHQMSQQACDFIDAHIDEEFKNPQIFLKAIPISFSEKDRNYILDVFRYSFNYSQVYTVLILIMFFLLVAAFLGREISSGKKYSIAHSLHFLHKAIHHLRDHWDQIFIKGDTGLSICKKAAKEFIQKSLDEVERYFSTVTGAPCRVCIKSLVPEDSTGREIKSRTVVIEDNRGFEEYDQITVKTFARSSNSHKPKQDRVQDCIYNNSDYMDIAKNGKSYYYIGNVNKAYGVYRNSHITSDNIKASRQLDYKSALTFAIRCMHPNSNTVELLGFLCVDSAITNIFSRRFDTQAGHLIADFYFLFLKKYTTLGAKRKEVQNA